MDAQTRETIGFPQFGEAVNRKIKAVRDALVAQGVEPPAQPLVFYIGGVRVAAAWSEDADRNTGIVRVIVGDEGDTGAVSFIVPARWALDESYTDADVDYLLAQNKPKSAPAASG